MSLASIQSANGQIFLCGKCDKIHVEFNGIGIDFANQFHLQAFYRYLKSIDGVYYEEKNRNKNYRRKILIPIPESKCKMLLTNGELTEFRQLIFSFLEKADHYQHTLQICNEYSAIINPSLN